MRYSVFAFVVLRIRQTLENSSEIYHPQVHDPETKMHSKHQVKQKTNFEKKNKRSKTLVEETTLPTLWGL